MSYEKDASKENSRTDQNEEPHKKEEKKQFIPRNSVFTDLLQTEHISPIYRCFIIALFVIYVRFVMAEYQNGSTISYGTKYIISGFSNIEKLVVFWLAMFFLTLLVYPAFHVWSVGVQKFVVRKHTLSLWNKTWLLGTLLYIFILIYIPIKYEAFSNAMATNMSILCEQIRFLMKTHAFLRHNCPRMLSYKPHSDKKMDRPMFSSFFYYLFAPTLVYRDVYPRSEKTNLGRVFRLSLEFIGCIFWISFMLHFVLERYKDFGLVKETYSSLFLSILDAMLVSPLFLLTVGYLILHVWLNIWSELLRFADRRFYAEWWLSQNFAMYYRNWNLVVHEYLHIYLYRDLTYLTSNKTVASLGTFFISIVVHEYIISFMIGSFFPVLALHYFITALIVRVKNYTFFNTFLIWGLSFGAAMELCFYTMEYFARVNCPIGDSSYTKYFQIRMLSCNGLDL